MTWVLGNLDLIWGLLLQHLAFALPPIVIGLVLAVPLGWLANRNPVVRSTLLNISGLLYTIPSLALFVLLPPLLGTGILNPANVIVALTVYTVALLVRTVADGLSAVPSIVVNSATAMGYTPFRRFVGVELPMAVPVILAGLRVASVSAISLVTVGAVIGFGGLGKMFTDAFQRDIPSETVAGIVLVLLLAVVLDAPDPARRTRAHAMDPRGPERGEARMSYFGVVVRPGQLVGSRRDPGPARGAPRLRGAHDDHRVGDRGAAGRLGRAHRAGRIPGRRLGQRPARAAHARRADPAGVPVRAEHRSARSSR